MSGENPFDDPSVTEAGSTYEYNPFEDRVDVDLGTAEVQAVGALGENRRGTLTRPDPVPRTHLDSSGGAFEAREEEIARREAELEYRERNLRTLEERLRVAEKPKNFPRLCPMVYHSIADEIPEHMKRSCQIGYVSYYLDIACYTINLLTIAAVMLSSMEISGSVGGFLMAVIMLIFSIPGAFYLWYWQLYKGARNSDSKRFGAFFVGYSIHLFAAVYMMIGIAGNGGGGWLVMFEAFKQKQRGVGFISLTCSILWTVNVVLSIYMMKRVWKFWRGFDRNGEQAKRGIARDLLAEGAKAAV